MKQLDHIGWDLWQASQSWKAQFQAGMVARGHPWFAEARGNLVHLISQQGTRQSEIVLRSQLTKQAVQQFIDELEQDGIVTRKPDPADARARIVRFTAAGQRALQDAEVVKRELHARYAARIGKASMAQLKSILDRLNKTGH